MFSLLTQAAAVGALSAAMAEGTNGQNCLGQFLLLPGDAKHIPLVLTAPAMQLNLSASFVSQRGLTLNTSERSRSPVQT